MDMVRAWQRSVLQLDAALGYNACTTRVRATNQRSVLQLDAALGYNACTTKARATNQRSTANVLLRDLCV